MTVYNSESLYITCSQDVKDRIDKLKQVISALEDQAIIAAGSSDISEYTLNDGQIIIKTAYRSPDAIAKAIFSFEKILNRLINRCSGQSITTLRDAHSFNNLRGNY